MLGNLSVEETERRAGVTFPPELVAYMEPRRQVNASKVGQGEWHCFDIPFTLVCGDRETATEIHRHLAPLSGDFKKPLNIALSPKERTEG